MHKYRSALSHAGRVAGSSRSLIEVLSSGPACSTSYLAPSFAATAHFQSSWSTGDRRFSSSVIPHLHNPSLSIIRPLSTTSRRGHVEKTSSTKERSPPPQFSASNGLEKKRSPVAPHRKTFLSAAQLARSKALAAAQTPRDVFALLESAEDSVVDSNLAAALVRLARLARDPRHLASLWEPASARRLRALIATASALPFHNHVSVTLSLYGIAKLAHATNQRLPDPAWPELSQLLRTLARGVNLLTAGAGARPATTPTHDRRPASEPHLDERAASTIVLSMAYLAPATFADFYEVADRATIARGVARVLDPRILGAQAAGNIAWALVRDGWVTDADAKVREPSLAAMETICGALMGPPNRRDVVITAATPRSALWPVLRDLDTGLLTNLFWSLGSVQLNDSVPINFIIERRLLPLAEAMAGSLGPHSLSSSLVGLTRRLELDPILNTSLYHRALAFVDAELAACNDFREQSIANTLHSFATLRYIPGRSLPVLLENATRLVRKLSPDALAQSFTFVGQFAPTLHAAGPEVWERGEIAESVERARTLLPRLTAGLTSAAMGRLMQGDMNVQAASSIVHSLSMMQQFDTPLFERLLCWLLEPSRHAELRQRYEAGGQLLRALEFSRALNNGTPATPALAVLYESRRALLTDLFAAQVEHCRNAIRATQVRRTKGGRFEDVVFQSVARVLTPGSGHRVEREREELGGLVSVDVAVTAADGTRIAVEADGPLHFWACAKPKGSTRPSVALAAPTGATLLRNAVLESLGWRVVSIPYFDWDLRMGPTESTRLGLLADKLRDAGLRGVVRELGPAGPRRSASGASETLDSAVTVAASSAQMHRPTRR